MEPASESEKADKDSDEANPKILPDVNTARSYMKQWKLYFEDSESTQNLLEQLRNRAFKDSLRSCHFRSVCWRVFLECLPADIEQWSPTIKVSRQEYEELKQSLASDPRNERFSQNIEEENPLSQSDKSTWSQYFKNSELRSLIERDVRRTCPEVDFYHSAKIHDVMANVLFCYARVHESLSYRQGMHELLAPLVFVLHSDLQGAAHARDVGELPDLVTEILDENYLEHDAYSIFNKLMEATNAWYAVTESRTNESSEAKPDVPIPTTPFQQPPEVHDSRMERKVQTRTSLEITNKLNHINESLLHYFDQELYHHLNRLQIIPQVYGLRWIRLLFGREFDLQDLLVLWDALFADSVTLDLVDYIFVAMMYNIRDRILTSDYCTCMQLLMKYPPIEDIYDLLHLAMYFRDPENHRRPSHFKFRQEPEIVDVKAVRNKPNSFFPFKLENPFKDLGRDLKKALSSSSPTTATGSPGSLRKAQTSSKQGERSEVERSPHMRARLLNDTYVRDLEAQVSSLQQLVQVYQEKCRFCSDKLEANIRLLEHDVGGRRSRSASATDAGDCPENENDDESYAVANLKQVRDILRGTLAMECWIPNYLLQTKPPGPGGQILEMKETTSVAGEKKESSVAGEKKETT